MGGGSADAAAALRLAAAAAGQDPASSGLQRLALELGADVPSQLAPERCLMTGIGEGVRGLGDPEPAGLLVVPSAHALSTAQVYAEFDRLGLGRDHDELDRLSGQVPGAARDGSLLAERLLHNDLEAAARSLCPPIGDALADVRAAGAVRAMVSGSGPTVFGIFAGADGAAHAQAAATALRPRHPRAVAVDAGRTRVRRARGDLRRAPRLDRRRGRAGAVPGATTPRARPRRSSQPARWRRWAPA